MSPVSPGDDSKTPGVQDSNYMEAASSTFIEMPTTSSTSSGLPTTTSNHTNVTSSTFIEMPTTSSTSSGLP